VPIDCESLLRQLQADPLAPVKPLALNVGESAGTLHVKCCLPRGVGAGMSSIWLDGAVCAWCTSHSLAYQGVGISWDLFGQTVWGAWKVEEYPEPDVVVKG
jgi:hypothetical protein